MMKETTTTTTSSTTLLDAIMTSNQKSREAEERSRTQPERVVSFDCIQIREYCLCLGDNPVAKGGPPLSLGWKHGPTMTFKVDDYEEARFASPGEAGPRVSAELLIPANIRFKLIRTHTNATKEEIRVTINDMKRIRSERKTSFALQEFENMIIAFESMREKVKGLRKRFSKSSSSSSSSITSSSTSITSSSTTSSSLSSKVVKNNKQGKGSSSCRDCNCKAAVVSTTKRNNGKIRRKDNDGNHHNDIDRTLHRREFTQTAIKKSIDNKDNHNQEDRQLFRERPVHSPLGNARAA